MPISMSAAWVGAARFCGAVLWFGMRAHILLKGAARQRRDARACCALLAAAPLLAGAAPHGDTSWRDIESRIQYGYYTEDDGALRGLQQTVAADESSDRLHGYYGALAAWRLAQLAAR